MTAFELQEKDQVKPVMIESRSWRYFHAIALDYDGTLTDGGRPNEELLNALREQRAGGRKLLLVTGRILAELRHEFFDMQEWFDIIVAENGAVILRGDISRTLAPPVPREFDSALYQRGVPFRRGQVLLAYDGQYDSVVFEELTRLGLDSHIMHNRGASMLLPAGVTKASGLLDALEALGVSAHSTLAVGDSENDLALLEACELGVAVANSVESLKSKADLVLEQPSSEGILELLRSPIVRNESRLAPGRWQVELGLSPEQRPVTLPASRINVLLTGPPVAGKSYVAGLLAEQLIALKYTLCIFDPEGDYVSLGLLRGVVVIGGEQPLPSMSELAHLLQYSNNSVVIDMSQLPLDEQLDYAAAALAVLRNQRARTGTPHWIFADEAHAAFNQRFSNLSLARGEKGYCIVTFNPSALFQDAGVEFDFVLLAGGGKDPAFDAIDYLSKLTHVPVAGFRSFLVEASQGEALLVRLSLPPQLNLFSIGHRSVRHVRHQHKYASTPLQTFHAFHFRNDAGATGRTAADFEGFYAELLCCDTTVLTHHARTYDFSRWIKDVMSDTALAYAVYGIEQRLAVADNDTALETLRVELLKLIGERYLQE